MDARVTPCGGGQITVEYGPEGRGIFTGCNSSHTGFGTPEIFDGGRPSRLPAGHRTGRAGATAQGGCIPLLRDIVEVRDVR